MKVYFLTEDEYAPFVQQNKECIFRAVHFTHSLENSDEFLGKASIVPLGKKSYEVWLADKPVTVHEVKGFKIFQTNNLMYVRFESNEDQDLEITTYDLYKSIFDIQKSLDAHLVRIWNYIPRILDHTGSLERYRHFNLGRRQAWEEFGPTDAQGNILTPAASGIGALGGSLKIGVLLSKKEPVHIQNKRQVNAFDYSNKYGPKPPTFSRATYLENVGLFISGTASILGEDTVHVGDPIEQTAETMRNIEALVSAENLKEYGLRGYTLDDITDWRLYIKNVHQTEMIEKKFLEIVDKKKDHITLHDDICRKNLLIEIEGVIFE